MRRRLARLTQRTAFLATGEPAGATAGPAGAPSPAPAARTASAWRGLRRDPGALAGGLILLAVMLLAAAADALFANGPLDMAGRPFLWPGAQAAFPLGTDSMGRDVAAGLAHGARISLLVGACSAIGSLLIGVTVGAAAGYFGGRTDRLLVRLIELFQTMPAFLLVIVLVAIGQPSLPVIVTAISVASWPTIARLVRAEFRSLRQAEFVLAARSAGFGHLHIMLREMLPNALAPVIVTTSVLVATAILMESALSFMGMGDPNVVSWGSMIGGARESIRTAWYLTALPGAALVLTVLALNLIGEALNDALNPRLGNRT